MSKKRTLSEEHRRKISESLSKYRKGKTYSELYGEAQGKEIARKHSEKLKGRKRAPFSDEWKRNMSESRKRSKVYRAFMSSEEYKQKRRAINAQRFYRLSLAEWEQFTGEKQLYYQRVRAVTKSQNVKLLEHYEKRGPSGKSGAYHLDHVYPVSIGYINNILPDIIGNIINLKFIPWEENLQKSNHLMEEAKKNIELLMSNKELISK